MSIGSPGPLGCFQGEPRSRMDSLIIEMSDALLKILYTHNSCSKIL